MPVVRLHMKGGLRYEVDGEFLTRDQFRQRRMAVAFTTALITASRDTESAQSACLECDWINRDWPSGPRCIHPQCGCPLSENRVMPWLNIAKCPAGKF